MSQAVAKLADARVLRARNAELANQLRVAAEDGDEARLTRLLAELLRCKGLSRGQRIALQQRALLGLVRSLRSAALSDDVTGLHNHRGFVQVGTRILDVAARDGRPAHLLCLGVEGLERVFEQQGRAGGHMLLRQTGNLLRDLFPGYGVYEVLGRIGHDEFAALSTDAVWLTRQGVQVRVGRALRRSACASLALRSAVAHFDPRRPIGIDELLEHARTELNGPRPESLSAAACTG